MHNVKTLKALTEDRIGGLQKSVTERRLGARKVGARLVRRSRARHLAE